MREQPDFRDDFEHELDNHGYAGANLDRITQRVCASDDYDGVEYEFYGPYIPVRPIIDVMSQQEGFRIESMGFVNESTEDNDLEPKLTVFVADVRQEFDTHPAFV